MATLEEAQEIPLKELLEAAALHDLARIQTIAIGIPPEARKELRAMCSLLYLGLEEPDES